METFQNWNPALDAFPYSGIRKMFTLANSIKDVIHLSIGQPDFPAPVHVVDAYVKALRDGKTGYTLDTGLPELVQVLADSYNQRFSTDLTPDNFIVTTGASEALFLAISSVAAPGREIIVIEPTFVLFPPIIKMFGATVKRIITTAKNGYQVDPQEVIDAMGPKTVAVIINSPGNPTGTIYPQSTMRAISDEANRRGIMLISDEIYDRLVLDDIEDPSILKCKPDLERVMIGGGASKTYSVPGFRIGWLISSAKNMQTLRRYHMFTTVVSNTAAQWAVAAALKGDQQCVADMVKEYKRRRDRIVDLVAETPHLTGYRPQGAFYIMPSLPVGVNMEEVAIRILNETGVCAIPGGTFGDSCANALRMSYATSLTKIETAFERMKPWFAKQSF